MNKSERLVAAACVVVVGFVGGYWAGHADASTDNAPASEDVVRYEPVAAQAAPTTITKRVPVTTTETVTETKKERTTETVPVTTTKTAPPRTVEVTKTVPATITPPLAERSAVREPRDRELLSARCLSTTIKPIRCDLATWVVTEKIDMDQIKDGETKHCEYRAEGTSIVAEHTILCLNTTWWVETNMPEILAEG